MEINDLQTYQDAMAFQRRIRNQALAILKRSKEAGIPDSEMRIGVSQLKPLIDPDFHDGKKGMSVDNLLYKIYRQANELMKLNFIVIDGGDMFTRRKAGFALLFRMMACDKGGKFYTCQDVSHKLQTINSTMDLNRNDIAEDLKTYDVLFLEEFRKEQMKTGFEVQWFMDEILTARTLHNKPTIFTFSNPVAGHGLSEENALTSTSSYGQYMCMLSQLDMKPIPQVLRIRVRCSYE